MDESGSSSDVIESLRKELRERLLNRHDACAAAAENASIISACFAIGVTLLILIPYASIHREQRSAQASVAALASFEMSVYRVLYVIAAIALAVAVWSFRRARAGPPV